MNHGAMVFLDAVDPVGTIRTRNYPIVGKVYEDLARYEAEIGGRFCQDVGIYLSFESCIDLREDGTPVAEYGHNFEHGRRPMGDNPHRAACTNLTKTLIEHHIPFGVVTKKSLGRLSDYQVILLPNVAVLDDEEVAAFRAFVRSGGGLYASRNTSILQPDGRRRPDFALADLFGASWAGETRDCVTYFMPVDAHGDLFPYFHPGLPIPLFDFQAIVAARPGAQVLATLSLPYTDPTGTPYASILCDPPGIHTDSPSMLLNRFGEGRAIYSGGMFESREHDRHRLIMAKLIRLLAARPFWFECEGPKPVELTYFLQGEGTRGILNVLNYQEELPNLPIFDLRIRVNAAGRLPVAVSILPARESIAFSKIGEFVEFVLPRLQDFAMVELRFESR
jgi:hypothetical protein